MSSVSQEIFEVAELDGANGIQRAIYIIFPLIKNTLLVFIDEFSPSSIDILIYCFSKSPAWEDWLETKEDIMIKISKLVKKNHCDFAYPTQSIVVKKEDDELGKIEEIKL